MSSVPMGFPFSHTPFILGEAFVHIWVNMTWTRVSCIFLSFHNTYEGDKLGPTFFFSFFLFNTKNIIKNIHIRQVKFSIYFSIKTYSFFSFLFFNKFYTTTILKHSH